MNNPEVNRISPPIPGVEIVVPLLLLPAYLKLHKLESVKYKEQEEILIVKKVDQTAGIT